MALITCQGACFAYEGREVLHHLSFSLEKGDYLCVVGENGSGKTTLMKGILGLLSPSHGKIERDISLHKCAVGYLPQRCAAQSDFPATVEEVVSSGLNALRPWLRKEERQQVKKNMDLLNVTPLAHRSFMELSGGQQQRVLLARALCAAGQVLLLDEPVTGLDPLITREMYDLIEELNHKQGLTVMMISHDLEAALRYANKILHLSQGKSFFGSVEEYRTSAFYQAFREENADA